MSKEAGVVERNAVIASAEIYRDNTYMGVELQLEYGNCGSQSAGRHVLCDRLLRRLMEVAGVDCWSAVVGRFVRVRGTRERVDALGHVLEDVWLDLRPELSAPLGDPVK